MTAKVRKVDEWIAAFVSGDDGNGIGVDGAAARRRHDQEVRKDVMRRDGMGSGWC